MLFGFFSIDSSHVNTNNRQHLLSTQETLLGSYVDHGDIILCNHVSYVELFYLAFRFAPTFATVVKVNNEAKSGGATTTPLKFAVVRHGFLGALSQVISEDQSSKAAIDSSSAQSLSDVVVYCKQYHMGPVVLFPEVVSSNGRSLLTFESSLFRAPGVMKTLVEQKVRIHLIGFKFDYVHFSPCFHHTSNFFVHLYRLTTQLYNRMTVKHVHLSQTERQQLWSEPRFTDVMRNYLASALKIQCVASSEKDKANFKDYWNKTKTRDYVKEE